MKTAPQTSSHSSSSNDEIDLGKLLGVLLDARWLIIVTTFAFTVIGIAYAILATPIYRADALVQVEEKSAGIPGLSDISDMFSSESTADTEIQIIRSRMVIGSAVDKLNLTVDAKPKLFPIIGIRLNSLLGFSLPEIEIKKLTVPQEFMDEPLLLTVDKSYESYHLSYEGNKILNGKIGETINNRGFVINISSLNAKNDDVFSISKYGRLETIKDLQDRLNVSEQGKKTGILKLTLEGEDLRKIQSILDSIANTYLMQNVERSSAEAEKSLTFLHQQVPLIREKLNKSEAKLNKFKSQNDSVDLQLEAESVLKTMVTVESQLNDLTFKESDIAQKYTKSHPAYLSLLEKRKALLKEKKRLDAQVEKMPKTQQEIIRLTRDVEVNQAIYIQLVGKMQELSVMKASTVGNVRILDDAATSEKPVKPQKAIVVAIFMFLGIFLSMVFAIIKNSFNKGVENPDDIEALGLPVYASVPRSELQVNLDNKSNSKVKEYKHHQTLLAKMNPADLAVEALRGLRTSLHFAMMEAKNNVVMFSGPAPGIGKSFVSSNFAVVAAQTGQKVLLVDADMRKGYLQRLFNVKAENGLSDILAGTSSIENTLKNSGIDGLEIVTRGQVPPNPSELLMHERFKQFIDWSAKHYDLVIVDTPPILAVTDAGIIGTHAGTTLMVGRFSFNSVKEIDVARNRFNQMGIEVKGFILNAVERKASSYYGEYGYYNYSYGTDGDKKIS